jgi:hypothetical protein
MFSLAVKFFKLICSFVYYFLADFCVTSSLFDLFFSLTLCCRFVLLLFWNVQVMLCRCLLCLLLLRRPVIVEKL